jgi:hypothetical protein
MHLKWRIKPISLTRFMDLGRHSWFKDFGSGYGDGFLEDVAVENPHPTGEGRVEVAVHVLGGETFGGFDDGSGGAGVELEILYGGDTLVRTGGAVDGGANGAG